ncbi:FAD:protein FMN transferase [Chitinibacteraceae bacterium HSL-7]
MKRLLVALLLIGILGGCTRTPWHQESFVFGTRVELTLFAGSDEQAQEAANAVLARLDQLHQRWHAWQPSELTRANAALARGQRIALQPDLAELLRQSARAEAASEHLFNPAIGQLIALWGFQSEEFATKPPPAEQVRALVARHPALSDLVWHGDSVSSTNPALQIDLGGAAKGWALDEAAALLRQRGILNALVNIGGNVIALGNKNGEPWRVGLQDPRAPRALAVVSLQDGEAVGTSGDYQRYFMHDGQRYHHLLDPETGYPAGKSRAAIVLISARPHAGLLSDIAGKPLFIAGAGKALALAKRLGVDQYLIIDASGRAHATRAMATRLDWQGQAPPLALAD